MRHAVVTREGRAGMMRADDLTPDETAEFLKSHPAFDGHQDL
jgi:hypothetical protein